MKKCGRCGSGGPFYGSKHNWCRECMKSYYREKRRKASAVWRTERRCKCGKAYIPYLKNQRWCHGRSCDAFKANDVERSRRNGARYRNRDRAGYRKRVRERRIAEALRDPIHVRAREMTAKLGWGKGSTKKMDEFLRPHIGTPCKWCGVELTLKNVSLDHKIPLIRAVVTPEQAKELNKIENLTFICRKCNRTKSSIPEDKFQKLMDWLKHDPELERLVLIRLRTSNLMWIKS